MRYQGTDRRQCTALRNHIDALLADGASLIGRDPVRLVYKKQTLTVQHGMLLSEPTPSELIDALNLLTEGEDSARAAAIETCLRYLDSALAPYPPFRYRTHELNENAAVSGSIFLDREWQ
ncbi:hypothetical protein [Stutzerimonas degradans]|uniref:Uncharacterized protein n=1 Tax=Stutzerimonas degradans TaxID=2968968 RepID=A0A8E2QFL8_9GAMM|nr:hypothetical protein [Stutzerimonas degradans]MCQ4274496.1 hypothetical protein [Stutzerimonas degradans]PNF77927.1 hypothetical protein CXK95_01130 [Stutzerimonas degradans]QPT23322.1 hypothetical protein I6G33_08740 [Stutzerimonas degradans]